MVNNWFPSRTADGEYRQKKEDFDSAVDAQGPEPIVQALRANVPGLKLYTRSSPRFEPLRAVYNKLIKSQPLVICRPNNVSQISAIVRITAEAKVPLGVRCGGHDVWGRGCIQDSVSIDMREMDSQTLADNKQTATIGGGVLSRNFVGFLDTHGLCTANGTAGGVGWTGWAIWGGYGPLNDYVGLGLDNIVATKVVTATGEIVEADKELLWGIKGAGGNLGIIVETTVRVYHMPRIIAGFIGFAWDEANKVMLALQDLLDKGIPDSLCMQMGYMKTKWGVGMSLIFMWPDEDFAEGMKWLEIVRGLGNITVDTVTETTFKDFQAITSRVVDPPVNVSTRCVCVPKFTPNTTSTLIKYTNQIPDVRQYNVIAHICHGKLTNKNPDSCFGTRQAHILFHINACDEPERMADAECWVDGIVGDLKATGEAMKGVYVSFMTETERRDEAFGANWEKMRALKQKMDQDNVFQFAQPKLS